MLSKTDKFFGRLIQIIVFGLVPLNLWWFYEAYAHPAKAEI